MVSSISKLIQIIFKRLILPINWTLTGTSTMSQRVMAIKWRCPWRNGNGHGVGNGHGDTSSNPGQDCISHSTNTLGKGMNPIILPPAMDK